MKKMEDRGEEDRGGGGQKKEKEKETFEFFLSFFLSKRGEKALDK